MPSIYRRILLKLSGEALGKNTGSSFDLDQIFQLALQLKKLQEEGVQIAVVTGGGNIIRGKEASSWQMHRQQLDQAGMLATAVNGIVLAEAVRSTGGFAKVLGAFPCGSIIESANAQTAVTLLENNHIVIFVGGTGNPYFTTDTAAALRACEIQADVLIKATKVDGIFAEDPMKNPLATHFPHLTYHEVLQLGLQVMDTSAIALCQENHIPIHVLNIYQKDALQDAVYWQKGGSLVTGESSCLKTK